ncbi:MAG TPA: endonuclease/exonuclease/phosphatase family protein [Bacteroidales bacterium]|nr:endonuclease/exonuclease/phosphatase family protein [Bacteroidales bacterium]HPS17884.1 endonuclease/exonuclease/phosphatase family protein [Bacteroidales bacterium]
MSAKGKPGFIIKLIFLLNIFIAVFLLLSYVAVYISPAKFWPIAFLGIAYPIIFLANFLFIIFWLLVRKKYALLSAFVIIIGINNVFKYIQTSKVYNEKELYDAIKVSSFNVRNFDLYNYGKRWEYNFSIKNQIFNLLEEEQPDILCLQEYVYDVTKKFNTTDTLKKFLKAKNANIYYTSESRKLNYFGIATFTSYPIIDTGSIAFKTVTGNICIYTDVIINSDTVRIYNVHLESIRLQPEDYILANNQKEHSQNDKKKEVTAKEGSERILRRLKKAFILRGAQADLVAEHISKCPYPIILCGDFNDTPVSYAYKKISSTLTDAFIESGNGTGQSYAGDFPSFRIDYIMHSKGFRAYNYETIYEQMSDHYPIKCFLKIDKNK